MRLDWQPKPNIDFEALSRICPIGEYRVIRPDMIPPGIISPSLLEKTHNILVLCSGTTNDRFYTMMNLNRIDGRDIDQMPFAMAFQGNESIPKSLLIQHADYHNRTLLYHQIFIDMLQQVELTHYKKCQQTTVAQFTT